MSVVPIRWRPLGTHDLEAGAALLTRAIAAWQQTWLVTPRIRAKAVALLTSRDEFTWPDTYSSWPIGDDVRVIAEPSQLAILVNQALDLPELFALRDESRPALLKDVEAQLVGELLDALHAAFAPIVPVARQAAGQARIAADAAPLHLPYGGASFELVDASGEAVLTVVCGAQTLWTCVAPEQPHAGQSDIRAPAPRSAAIEDSRVAVCAMLGQCELSVPQLATLAVGDVIALDHALTDPLALMLIQPDHGCGTPIAAGTPGQRAGRFSIQLTSIGRPDTP
ncbi:hypothetical protein BTH42_14965 [Burkholderia sp. SRS-W-2-2016]|uniref:FliM/FliN family flagellar motor C-terminal domain-containing protein n=1 Tax=Burkholderia sp. SRS-W-2-2016 TaxID=1926878 RepID=UPI00094B4638|nr:FliM/FliN family flagellar motor C-terminal domain-containing protein [Burkholderia sp. SRS-W-2-2016]OLL30873.1 hypothetical protein BTH42_14965 [Burkholderia sp. SRS-W-2-2016]